MQPFACIAIFAALSLFAVPSRAQEVGITGKVVRHGSQFSIDCTDIRLQSSTVRLQDFKNEEVSLEGQNVGTASDPLIEVASIHRATDLLSLSGRTKLGDEIELKLVSPTGVFYAFLYASGPGFYVPDPLSAFRGTLLLDLGTTFIFASGPVTGDDRYAIPIPRDQSLVGLEFWMQAAILVSPWTVQYLNVVCGTVQR